MSTAQSLIDYISDQKIKRSALARALGVSEATLSQYLAGKYPGNNAEIDRKVLSFLKRDQMRIKAAAILPEDRFVMTRQAQRVYGLLSTCHLDGDMGLIVGEPGLGKTRSLEQYARENNGVLLITPLKTNTMMTLLKSITETLRVKTGDSNDARARGIIQILKGSGRMMIVDEAHFLSFPCLEILRQIHDGTGIGLVYAGPEALRIKISNRDVEQIYSRIGVTATLPALNHSDTCLILKSTGIKYNDAAAKKLVEVSLGSGRRSSKTFKRSCRIANGAEITAQHIVLAEKQSVMG